MGYAGNILVFALNFIVMQDRNVNRENRYFDDFLYVQQVITEFNINFTS